MNTQQTYKLTLRPFVWTNDGPLLNHDAPAAAFVDGLPNDEIVQVINTRASGRESLWQIRFVTTDTYTGDYKTAEEALAALEQWINTPNNTSLTISELLGDFSDRSALRYLQGHGSWGINPKHISRLQKRGYLDENERLTAEGRVFMEQAA
jgi:hypothetical protein